MSSMQGRTSSVPVLIHAHQCSDRTGSLNLGNKRITSVLSRERIMESYIMKYIKEGPFQIGKRSQMLLLEGAGGCCFNKGYTKDISASQSLTDGPKTFGKGEDDSGRAQNRGGLDYPGQAKSPSRTYSGQDATNASPRRVGASTGNEEQTLFLAGERLPTLDDVWIIQPRMIWTQFVEDNAEHVVQCNASSVRNDALMSILDEMHEQGVQSRLTNKPDMVMNDSVTSELARYKESGGNMKKRAKFEIN
ncbi:hypothetical protein Tco_0865701 [Tanacetum coccineum]